MEKYDVFFAVWIPGIFIMRSISLAVHGLLEFEANSSQTSTRLAGRHVSGWNLLEGNHLKILWDIPKHYLCWHHFQRHSVSMLFTWIMFDRRANRVPTMPHKWDASCGKNQWSTTSTISLVVISVSKSGSDPFKLNIAYFGKVTQQWYPEIHLLTHYTIEMFHIWFTESTVHMSSFPRRHVLTCIVSATTTAGKRYIWLRPGEWDLWIRHIKARGHKTY